MKDTNTPLFSLLKEKSELKRQIKFAKQNVDSQKQQIEIQTERAKNGLTNTLAFEQRELPKFLSELLNLEKQLEDLKIDIKIAETQPNKITTELVPHNFNEKDEDGFPINALGSQIPLVDGNGNVFIPLKSNIFINIQEKAGIQFNPKDKFEVNLAVDTLVNILTHNFYKKLENYFTIDLSDDCKKTNNIRTKEPLKILHIQIYFDWINKWLKYFGNVFNFEFKLLFYSKYKEKIKNDILSLETGLKEINAPKSHIDFAKRWIEETDKNIEIETKAKEKKGTETSQIQPENAHSKKQVNNCGINNKCKYFDTEKRCECYNDWYKPALDLSNEKEAETFTLIFQSLKNTFNSTAFTNDFSISKVIEEIEETKPLIPIELFQLFKECFLKWFLFNYNWRFTKPKNKLEIEKYINDLKNPILNSKIEIKTASKKEYSENIIEFNFNNFNTIASIKTLFPNITLEQFQEEIFYPLENIAFKYRGNPVSFWNTFEPMLNVYSDEQKEIIVALLINHKSNWNGGETWKLLNSYFQNNFKQNKENIEPNNSNSFPNQSKPLNLESIMREQNNLLPKLTIQEVYNHFNILTTSTNKNNQFYLTNEQLLVFILSTFIEQKPIKQDFNCEGFVKKDIRKIFFDFYFKNKNKETNQTRLKRKYFNIMNNAFNGFNENDYTDFAK